MRAEEFIIEKKNKKRKRSRWAVYGPGPYGGYGYAVGYSGDGGSDGGAVGEASKNTNENFADGKNPGRKGLSRRVGIPKKATLGQLQKIASSSTGERRRMAQWQLNMKSGKSKKNK